MSSNVISLTRHQTTKSNTLPALVHNFAKMRRDPNDVFWLKENAEILNILESSGSQDRDLGINVYSDFYADLPKRLAFFPQYYRFYLSIACDLEALGIKGDIAEQLCDFAVKHSLDHSELSDLQRAEAMRLLARRGFQIQSTQSLKERLHTFIDHCSGFALPNRKAAYELTHIVFYLSQYGRCDPEISENAVQSLMFTGILAHLEQNADLLAEVCIALRYARVAPPKSWESWISSVTNAFVQRDGDVGYSDGYHEYLVCNWACAEMNKHSFDQSYSFNGSAFQSPITPLGTLGQISEVLLDWKGPRVRSWRAMRASLFAELPDHVADHLEDVVASTQFFEAFFEHFVRSNSIGTDRNPLLTVPKLETVR